MKTPLVRRVEFRRALRIIPSRYPPRGVFDTVASPADLEAVFYVEALTNERLRAEIGDLTLVARGDWVTGPGSTPIMSAFTHVNPDGSRFSDGTYGVYYAAKDEETAIAEARHARMRFLHYSGEPAQRFEMRMYVGAIRGRLYDLRGLRTCYPDLYDPDDYHAGQVFARPLRAAGAFGIVYGSVRRTGGECIAAFRPTVVHPVVQARHFYFMWNGSAITDVIRVERAG